MRRLRLTSALLTLAVRGALHVQTVAAGAVPTHAPTHARGHGDDRAPHYRGACPAQLQPPAPVSGLATGGIASYRFTVSGQQDRSGTV